MRLAKAEKRFNKCSLLQRNLEELHTLTGALPSVSKIEDEIRFVPYSCALVYLEGEPR